MILIVCRKRARILLLLNIMPKRSGDRNYLIAIGAAVRELRTTAKLSQEELAEKADLHRTYVGGVERGERNVTAQSLLRISKALSTTPAVIMSRAEQILKKK